MRFNCLQYYHIYAFSIDLICKKSAKKKRISTKQGHLNRHDTYIKQKSANN